MASLSFNTLSLQLRPNESVLDCLLRHGQPLPYSCKAGMCQACLVKALTPPPDEAQVGLKASLREQGCALACQWFPASDIAASSIDPNAFSLAARVAELTQLNAHVLKVVLAPVERSGMFASRPGQYLTLSNPAGVVRSYSIANDYEQDQVLELHIAATSQGLLTHWLFDNAQVGDVVHLRGPAGDCFYEPREIDSTTTPLVLAGTGTGLAPLYGVARDALSRGHRAPIQLFHGGRTEDHLYYQTQLRQLQQEFPNFQYYPCLREPPANKETRVEIGPIEAIVGKHLSSNTAGQTYAYLAGAPDVVQTLRKRLFLEGVRSAHIHADPFTERKIEAV